MPSRTHRDILNDALMTLFNAVHFNFIETLMNIVNHANKLCTMIYIYIYLCAIVVIIATSLRKSLMQHYKI